MTLLKVQRLRQTNFNQVYEACTINVKFFNWKRRLQVYIGYLNSLVSYFLTLNEGKEIVYNVEVQSPFLSVCMYLGETDEYKEELAMLIEEFLKQRIEGMPNRQGVLVTPAFPKLLYVLEEDNIHEDSPYFYLTKLAAKCTAKRLVPDYISEKVMKRLKIDKNGNGQCYPCMNKPVPYIGDNISKPA